MWLDHLQTGDSWMGVWKYKFHCGNCGAIIDNNPCAVCGYLHLPQVIPGMPPEARIPQITYKGAISEHTYITLGLMQREWERPIVPEGEMSGLLGEKIPQRILIVLLFWSLFEHLMDRLLTAKLETLPPAIAKHLLKKNNNISSRMGEFYQLVFEQSFKDDLLAVGYPQVYGHLRKLQDSRNAFMHDKPSAIDEQLISETVEHLQDVQSAWIAIFNSNCTKT